MNSETVALRRYTLPAALLASAILAASASADYHFDTDTMVAGDTVLDDSERFFLENGAILDSVAGSAFTSNRPLEEGYGFILESGTLNNIFLKGSADLVKTTGGTVEINAVQEYTGGTRIEGGLVTLTVDNALQASAGVAVEYGARLDIGGSSQDFQWLTLWDGTLEGAPGSIASSQNSFTADTGTSWVVLADSSAPGARPASFIKLGTGTFTFHAQNTYTGDTNILTGTLDMGETNYAISRESAVALGSNATWEMSNTTQEVGSLGDAWTWEPYNGTVNLGTSGHLLTGYDNTDTTYSGSIVADGGATNSVRKVGLGTWTFDGTTVGLAGFSVNSGALFANGYVDASFVGAQRTGAEIPLFGGTGHLDADYFFAIGGIIMPGTRFAPGSLTVGGPGREGRFWLDADSTLLIRVGSRDQYGSIVTTGYAFLSGDLVVTPWEGYRPTFRHSYTLVRAGDGMDNQLQNIELALPETMLKPHVRQVDHADGSSELRLTFEQRKFNNLRQLDAKYRPIARSLDREGPTGRINSLVDRLDQLPIDQVPDAVALLSPEQVSAVFQIGFSGARTQFNNMEHRLEMARSADNNLVGFCASGLVLSDARGSVHANGTPVTRGDGALSLAGYDGKSIVAKSAVAPVVEESRWGFFATGTGEWADIESTDLARGSEFTTGGVTIGADYRVSNNLIVGLAGGYANTGSDLWDGGRITLNSGKGNAYASLFNENAYLNASVGGAYNAIGTRRSTFGGIARADAEGGEFNAMLGGGYDIQPLSGFTVGPIASLQYTWFGLNDYREHGSDAPLEFPTQSQESLRSTLGLRASYAVQLGNILLTPEVRAQWAHEYLDSTAAVVSRFAGAGSTFRVLGPEIGRDSLVLDAGVTAWLNPEVALFAWYTGEIGRTNYSSNSVNGGFRISF